MSIEHDRWQASCSSKWLPGLQHATTTQIISIRAAAALLTLHAEPAAAVFAVCRFDCRPARPAALCRCPRACRRQLDSADVAAGARQQVQAGSGASLFAAVICGCRGLAVCWPLGRSGGSGGGISSGAVGFGRGQRVKQSHCAKYGCLKRICAGKDSPGCWVKSEKRSPSRFGPRWRRRRLVRRYRPVLTFTGVAVLTSHFHAPIQRGATPPAAARADLASALESRGSRALLHLLHTSLAADKSCWIDPLKLGWRAQHSGGSGRR